MENCAVDWKEKTHTRLCQNSKRKIIKVTKFFFNYEGKEPQTNPLAPFFLLPTLNDNLSSLFCLDHGELFSESSAQGTGSPRV